MNEPEPTEPQQLYRYRGPDTAFRGDIYRIGMVTAKEVFAISMRAAWSGGPKQFAAEFEKLPPDDVEQEPEAVCY